MDAGPEVLDVSFEESTVTDPGAGDTTLDVGPPPPFYPITKVTVDDHITYRPGHHKYPHWTGDLWPCTWGDDERLYTACGDGMGFGMAQKTGRRLNRRMKARTSQNGVRTRGQPEGRDQVRGRTRSVPLPG